MIEAGSSGRAHLARAFDIVAEATVAPSFSRIGIELRRRLEEWDEPPSMEGRAVVVTGATSGIGLATASALAGLGATVTLVGRDAERAEEARLAVESAGPGPVHIDIVDIADPEAVSGVRSPRARRHGELAALDPQRRVAHAVLHQDRRRNGTDCRHPGARPLRPHRWFGTAALA